MPSRACDACKGRKVKCDGLESTAPCSNCRMSNLPCLYLHVPKKRGPQPHQARYSIRSHRGSRSARGEESLSQNDSSMTLSPSVETPSSFETPGVFSLDHATSTWIVGAPSSIVRQASRDINESIQAIHQDLILTLGLRMPNLTLEQIITKCIDIYMQTIFPIGLLLHEPSLRSNVKLQAPLVAGMAAFLGPIGGFYSSSGNLEDLARLRSYTLTISLCAVSAFLLPPETVSNGATVGLVFLRASREMLKLYHDFDIERPNSTSLLIRIFHAGALHTDGRIRVAGQVLGEGLRLAEQMRLYEEHSFEGVEPVEARIRRLVFWQLYILDKFSAIVDDRPMAFHEFSLNGCLTTELQDELEVRLMDPMTTKCSIEFEAQLLTGLYTYQRLWTTASDVLLDLQTLSWLCRRVEKAIMFDEAQKIGLTGTYLQFLSVLDTLPSFLQSPDTIRSADETATEYQRRLLWVQRANLLLTYHFLRLVLLQRFNDLGLASLLGVRDESVMLALRKTEIAHDVINTITSVPFDSLRASGEACVTKIRRVGATVLEVMHQTDAPQIASRAKSLFPPLLDILTKLDSRASDELEQEYIH